MKERNNPMKYAVCALLLACLTGMFLGSCGTDTCTVIMEEAYAIAEPVTLTIEWNGTSYADLAFYIDEIQYTLTDAPTVSDPVFRLETKAEDGMDSVSLHMAYDEAEVCELHIMPAEGNERVFVCEKNEMERFYAWIRSN